MIAALILHRKIDGARVLVSVTAMNIAEPPEVPANATLTVDMWPYLETFDEVANALNALNVIDSDEAAKRCGEAAHHRGERDPFRFLIEARAQKRCPLNVMGVTRTGRPQRCRREDGHQPPCS